MSENTQCYQEIITQKLAWQEAVQITSQHKDQIIEFFDTLKPSQVFFVGCTSPYYAGTSAAAFWKSETGMEARAVPSSELILYPSIYYPGPLSQPVLITLSRSGKTTETILAVDSFNQRYTGRTLLIGCNPQGPLVDMARLSLILEKSAEQTIPQTRSLSAMYLSALLITAYYSGHAELIKMLEQSPVVVDPIIQKSEPKVKALFEHGKYDNIFILGSGFLYGMALEIGLKCMEMTTTDTFSYQFLESRHGPRALIDERSLVVGLYSRGGLNYEAQVMTELTARHRATTLAIVPEEGWTTGDVTSSIAVDSSWPDGLLGLAYLPVGQLVAYYTALSKGLNPDVARHHTAYVEIQRF